MYTLYKHYDVSGQTSCASYNQHLLFQVSGDRGQTWSAPAAIDPEATEGGQFDPQIAVDPVDGKTVWASYLQNEKSSIAVMKSSTFGQTWQGPVIVENLQRATDKDILAVRGQMIRRLQRSPEDLCTDLARRGHHLDDCARQRRRHPVRLVARRRGGIDSQGNIYFAWDGFTQNGGAKGPVNLYVSESCDSGQTWDLLTSAERTKEVRDWGVWG